MKYWYNEKEYQEMQQGMLELAVKIAELKTENTRLKDENQFLRELVKSKESHDE